MAGARAVYPMRDPGRGAPAPTGGGAGPGGRLPALAATVGSGWEFDTGWLRGRWVALVCWPRPSSLESIHEVAELVRSTAVYAERDTLFVAVSGALETAPGNGNVH